MANLKAPKPKELKLEELRWYCNPDIFEFESTSKVKPIEGVVGQERALKALKLGVDMDSPGYNIFVTGLSGTGKMYTIKSMLETISPECSNLKDYAYVNNFEDVDRPKLLEFNAGKACKFRKDLLDSIKYLQEHIPQALESESFLEIKKNVIASYSEEQQKMLNEFEALLNKEGLTLGQIKVGEVPRPEILAIIEEQPVMVQQLEQYVKEKKITKEDAERIILKYGEFQQELQTLFKNSLKRSQDLRDAISKLEANEVEHLINAVIGHLKAVYKNKSVSEYLEKVKENINANLEVFKGVKPAQEKSDAGYIVDYLKDYEVNIILDNTNTKQCPVYIETSPTYTNLFGTIEKYSDGQGGWYADFTRIKGGSLLRASGGYIVINAMDAFSEPGVWKALKRVLLYGKLEIQDLANFYQFSPSIIKPEPIEIKAKVILVGNNYVYSILSNYEDDFNKIFKIKAEFDYEMKLTDTALNEYARIIKKLIENENLFEFDKTAIAKIAEYGARYAGEKNKLTTRFAYITDLTRESSFWAKDNGDDIVTAYHVNQAYKSARERHNLYESKVSEMITTGSIMIDTKGERIGQVNGLAVYGNGNYSFGKPTRITASVSLGNGNIINVEREAGLSGNTHNKGVLVITGYFKGTFGNKVPLSFNASLVFEQGYGMIDGDSASITEICALISCLSEIPLKQYIAITGSVNQKGDIQPIGGVNEKIEGFFDICKSAGLNKKQGVIIPMQNVKDLMLKDEVIDAVSKKEFHIYPVEKVEEAIEILTGVKAGKLTARGNFELNSVFGKVEKKLEKMHKLSRPKQQKQSSHTKSKTAKGKK